MATTDGKPLSPSISKYASEVHEVSLLLEHAAAMLASLHLDILVFADVLSEPMNHFLAHSRLAPVQVRAVGVLSSYWFMIHAFDALRLHFGEIP